MTQHGRSFALNAVPAVPPLRKDYAFANDVDTLPTFDHVVVAEVEGHPAGVAALKFEAWNRRAILWHFYVEPAHRGRGIGRALIEAAVAYGQARQARCLWLETQTINYPAIQFYERLGFVWCGLDTTLYDGQGVEEVALFFARPLG